MYWYLCIFKTHWNILLKLLILLEWKLFYINFHLSSCLDNLLSGSKNKTTTTDLSYVWFNIVVVNILYNEFMLIRDQKGKLQQQEQQIWKEISLIFKTTIDVCLVVKFLSEGKQQNKDVINGNLFSFWSAGEGYIHPSVYSCLHQAVVAIPNSTNLTQT